MGLSSRLNINRPFSLKLLYRSTRDGNNAFTFQSKCDGIPNTVTLIQSQHNHVFGGFTRIPWTEQSENVNASRFKDTSRDQFDTFLFILRSNEEETRARLPVL